MSEPFSPADAYLAAFNAALRVGLRNRSRILAEVEQHLHEATEAHWTAMLEETERVGGAADRSDQELWVEAQRRAVAAFGSPQEVAASFEAGLIGALDRRVAIIARRLDVWLAHPLPGTALRLALVLTAYLVVVALAELFHARSTLAETARALLTAGTAWALARGAQAYALRGRPEPGFRARIRSCRARIRSCGRVYWPFRVGGEALNPAQIGFFTYMLLTNVFSVLPGSLYGSSSSLRGILLLNFCVALLVLAAVLLTERVEARAARGDPAESSAEKRWAWRAEHPWPAAFLRTLPLPLSLLALLALSFTFPGSRLAVGVLFAVATALLVVGVRLAQNADERDTFEWRLPRSD